jgi:hypothetical protein
MIMKAQTVGRPIILFLVIAFFGVVSVVAQSREIVVSGVVRDKDGRRRIESADVSLVGTSIGTVTNADGVFQLKLPLDKIDGGLEVSHLGYINVHISSDDLRRNEKPFTVLMTAATNQLGEVVIYGGPARQLVEEAMRKISVNYPDEANTLNMFYRETIRKRHRYVAISEAMINVYKSDYKRRDISRERVQLHKGRRLLNQKAADTLAVKVQGGPNMPIGLDIVKNGDELFDSKTLDYYTFRQELPVMLDNRMHYVVSFTPCVRVDYALYSGRLYIDSETMSFTRAEFSLDMSDKVKAVAAILYKKPLGLLFTPYEVSFVVAYRRQGSVSVLNYVSNTIRFKCDWKRRLFSSSYTACSEMVMVDRDEHPKETIRMKDAFGQRDIFYDVVDAYWNEDFWKDYNIIEPTESLENAVKKLRKHKADK